MGVESISALPFQVGNMKASVRFCHDVLGMVLCGVAEVWVNRNDPHIKQSFGDVESILVPLAPTAVLTR
jgi:hypothetical protein